MNNIFNWGGKDRKTKLAAIAADIISNRPSLPFSEDGKKTSSGYLILIAFIAFLVFLAFRGSNVISVDHGATYHAGNVININNAKSLRQWSTLSQEEREQIKVEAIKRFPEITRIGEGVRWKPVAEWMAEEKGVTTSNVRDLFRRRDEK